MPEVDGEKERVGELNKQTAEIPSECWTSLDGAGAKSKINWFLFYILGNKQNTETNPFSKLLFGAVLINFAEQERELSWVRFRPQNDDAADDDKVRSEFSRLFN